MYHGGRSSHLTWSVPASSRRRCMHAGKQVSPTSSDAKEHTRPWDALRNISKSIFSESPMTSDRLAMDFQAQHPMPQARLTQCLDKDVVESNGDQRSLPRHDNAGHLAAVFLSQGRREWKPYSIRVRELDQGRNQCR
jgi:hypothetical protein